MDEALSKLFLEVGDRHWWFEGRRRIVEEELRRVLGPPDEHEYRLLDVGCGSGSMIPVLSPHGEVGAMDTFAGSIAAVAARFPEVVAQVGAVPDDLPMVPSVDVIAMFDVLEHLDDDVGAVRRVVAALRPGGTFVCTVPAFPSLWGRQDVVSNHRRRYRAGPLREVLVDAGLEVVRLTYFNTLMFPLVALLRLARRATGRPGGEGTTDFDHSLPGPVNRALAELFAAERFALRRGTLPFGVSLFAAGRVPSRGRSD